jgi:anti-anti-sigma factor
MERAYGRIFVARFAAGSGVRIEGRAAAHNCPALRQWLEEELEDGTERVFIDLAGCTHLDSTCVGTLLFLAKHPQLQRGGLQLVRPSAECQQVLRQMCVLRMFAIGDEAGGMPAGHENEGFWSELTCEWNDGARQLFKQNVVQAHEELAGVPSPLSDCFRQIAEEGKKELQEAHSGPPRDA